MLKFDDIPDVSYIESFLSENNVAITTEEQVWAIARQSEDIPNFDNIFLELTYEKIPFAIEKYFSNPSNKEDIAEEIHVLLEIQDEYSYAIEPQLVEKINDEEDSLSKLLLEAVEQYQDKKEYIPDIFNDYGVMETSVNNLDSHVYINGEEVESKNDFVKHTISAMFFEYSDNFSLLNTVQQVLSNPSKYLKLEDNSCKTKNKRKI